MAKLQGRGTEYRGQGTEFKGRGTEYRAKVEYKAKVLSTGPRYRVQGRGTDYRAGYRVQGQRYRVQGRGTEYSGPEVQSTVGPRYRVQGPWYRVHKGRVTEWLITTSVLVKLQLLLTVREETNLFMIYSE